MSGHKIIEDAERILRGEHVELITPIIKKRRQKKLKPQQVIWRNSQKYLDKLSEHIDSMLDDVDEEFGHLYGCECGGDHARHEFYTIELIPWLHDIFAADFRRYERAMRDIWKADKLKAAKSKRRKSKNA